MSLLDNALKALNNQVDDKADDWFDKLVGKLDELIKDTSDAELKQGGKAAIEVLRKNQDKFVGLGRKSFTYFMAHAAAGKVGEATKEYYRQKASAREIIDSILDDALDLNRARKEAEALKKEAAELVKVIAQGARFLLPLLLTLF